MTAEYVPPMERVRLLGGPLSGYHRHVERGKTQAWFKQALGDRKFLYRRGPDGVWRYDGGAKS